MTDGLWMGEELRFPPDIITETVLIIAKRGSGKALALDTLLPTPSGWTTMGAVQVGDEVLDERGLPCKVTYATDEMDDHVCYRVTFDDGSEIVADAEHLWLSETLASRRADGQARFYPARQRGFGGRPQCERTARPALLTTEQIRQTLHVPIGSAGRRDRNHSVRNSAALDLPEASLPVDPYVLGIWAGDGTSTSGSVTCGHGDEQIIDEVRASGYGVTEFPSARASGRAPVYNITGLMKSLRCIGVLGNKHIPAPYLRASADQRLALLQGLMDSDGTIGTGSNSCVFANTNERLSDAVAELVASLGWVARCGKRTAKLNGIEHGISHEVRFRPDQCVFRLARKAARFKADATQGSRHERRMIVAVEPVASVSVRCIAVDTPSHLYLAGRSMIPTHNTYSASVLVEEMVGAGLPVCVLDPLGVWWGLRSSADGQGPGLPVIIIGGEHADLPLPADGAAVADLVIDERVPVVIDLSELSKTRQRAFVCAFLEKLYHRNREPLHVVVDEADLFAPLRGGKDTMRLLGAYEDIVRRGRARGLGCTSITQRPAVLHTDIRSQAEVLIALRLIGTHDVAAIDEWVRLHATDEEARAVKASLPSLPVGTAWVWSPGWLELLVKVKIRQRRTFDSSATPKVGQQRIVPRSFARVDQSELDRMAGRLAPAPAEAPAQRGRMPADQARDMEIGKLRTQVADLRGQLAEALARPPEQVEVPVLAPGDVAALEQAIAAARDLAGGIELALGLAVAAPRPAPVPRAEPQRQPRAAALQEMPGLTDPRAAATARALTRAERAILTVLAQFPAGRTKRQLAMLAGYSAKGGGFNNSLSSLRTAGLIERGDPIRVRDEGLAALGTWEPLPEGAALIEHWMGQLAKAEAEALRVLLDAWPASLTKTEIAARTDKGDGEPYSPEGGGFNNALSKLRTLQLIDGYRDIRADETLAEAYVGVRR